MIIILLERVADKTCVGMPYSSDIFDSTVAALLREVKPSRCLDVGAGAGKYGRLIRQNLPHATAVAVEVEPDYIRKYHLREVYTEIYEMNAIDLIASAVDETYDVAILGDVLEHMRKSEGIDLLHFLIYRTRWIIVIYPTRYVQYSVNGYRSEAHISTWRARDFSPFDRTSVYRRGGQNLVVLRGYLSHRRTLELLGYRVRTATTPSGRSPAPRQR